MVLQWADWKVCQSFAHGPEKGWEVEASPGIQSAFLDQASIVFRAGITQDWE